MKLSGKKSYSRFKIGRLLEEKYGIKRCIIFCGAKDALTDFPKEQKIAAQLYLVQRVLQPRSETYGLVLGCLLDPNCDATKTDPTDTPSNPCTSGQEGDCELGGEDESGIETSVRTSLEENALDLGLDDAAVDLLIDTYNSIVEKGYSNYAIDAILTKLGLSALSDQVADKAPIIGWINQAAQLIGVAAKAGPKIKTLSYIINSGAAVSLFENFNTYADEIKTGNVNATEVGSFVDMLGPGSSSTTDPEVGGNATAEATPLYAATIGNTDPSGPVVSSSSTGGLVTGAAYAASPSTTNSTYLCNNNEPPPQGSLVCPEEKLGTGNQYVTDISNALNNDFPGLVTAANFFNSYPGKILNAFGSFLGQVLKYFPGFSDLESFINGIISPFFKDVFQKLIPDPFSTNMSGGRTFDEMAAGADVSGNDYAHNGLGGEALTPQQSAQQLSEQTSQNIHDFQSESFLARIFDTSTPYSLISKLAVDMPVNNWVTSIESTIANPTRLVTPLFSALSMNKISAATPAEPDPFGVTQYGYPTVPSDPQQYWDQNCNDLTIDTVATGAATVAYNANAQNNLDPNNGQPQNLPASEGGSGTDPCLLIQATVGSAGGYYKSSLMTPDDMADSNGGSVSEVINSQQNSSSSGFASITHGLEELVKGL